MKRIAIIALALIPAFIFTACGGGGGDDPVDMALIPAGTFYMGDAFAPEGDGDEVPYHRVRISGFYMDVHEVTNAEYAACVTDGGCTAPSSSMSNSRANYYANPDYDDFPILYVNWYQAVAYCTWAGKRLPTEAEWEYAARGGLEGKRYPWGDELSGEDANYLDSGDAWDNDTSPVESYPPNGYGLYDVAGNVWEWVSDRYSETYYAEVEDLVLDPQGPDSGEYRVLRGGACIYNTSGLRVSDRSDDDPALVGGDNLGFRCARD